MPYADQAAPAGPQSAAQPHAHVYDKVSTDVANYIERMSDQLALGMMEHGRAPFAATLTRQQQDDYYVREYGGLVYDAAGQPDDEGRKKLEKAFGPDGFTAIVQAVVRHRRRQAALGLPLSYPRTTPSEPAGAPAVGVPPPAPPVGRP